MGVSGELGYPDHIPSGSPSSADMPSSQPIDIPDAKKRGRKKKRCRATDSFSGRFEGELQRGAGPTGEGTLGYKPFTSPLAPQMSTSCRRMCWGKGPMPVCRPVSISSPTRNMLSR